MKSTVLAALVPMANGPYPGAMVPACALVSKNFTTIAADAETALVEVESDHAAVAALADCIELASESDKRTTKPTLTGKSKKLADAINAKHKAGMTREALVESLKAK